ncbi:retrovirus-related Pol polyprotein from transposon opus [Trichonephila clavipes]|nr:retrovirus-related Pol polyprotein from transposon opus [Trichonephila clavipes]
MISESANNQFTDRNRQENWRDTKVETRYHDTSRAQRESNRFGGQGVGDNRRCDSRRRSGQSDHRFNNHGGRQGGSRNGAFRGQNGRDRYFSYRTRQRTKDRVVTASCCHLGRVELQIRIRDFQKTWEFHILDNMQYQCIIGIDFMKDSRLTLDFDKKSLVIPDDQIKPLSIVEKPVEIDLSNTKLSERQKEELQDLFNSFKGLFSDKPGLTHVLYHEIDTRDQGPVMSRPYRYDSQTGGSRLSHSKSVKEGTIRPIQSPYASPIVLTRKNNGLPPDSPEAYRFAIDYRKLNAITKYPRYPLPLIDELLTNIPFTTIMSTLDLRSGYFQLAVNPRDIEKTAFITRSGTFTFQPHAVRPFWGGAKFSKSDRYYT